MNDLDDYEEDPYDYCYECSGYGDDYCMDEDGELDFIKKYIKEEGD